MGGPPRSLLRQTDSAIAGPCGRRIGTCAFPSLVLPRQPLFARVLVLPFASASRGRDNGDHRWPAAQPGPSRQEPRRADP
jgi:hypothetical protein